MATEREKELWRKVAKVGGEAINAKGYVTSIDILLGLGWLSRSDLEAWRRGQIPYLEKVVHANLSKISRAMKALRSWAAQAKLKPSSTVYKRKGHRLRFSKFGDESIEKNYSTHFVLHAKLPAKQRRSDGEIEEKGEPHDTPPYDQNASDKNPSDTIADPGPISID